DGAAVVLLKLPGRIGREDLIVGFAVKIGPCNSEGFFRSVIGIDVDAVCVLDPGKSGQLLHESGKTLLAFAESFFHYLSLCDIDPDAIKPDRFTAVGVDRLSATLHPAH